MWGWCYVFDSSYVHSHILKSPYCCFLPAPVPLMIISNLCIPNSVARLTASSAATWAAYGVDFLEPLNPTEPPDVHTTVSPFVSEIFIIAVSYTHLTLPTILRV